MWANQYFPLKNMNQVCILRKYHLNPSIIRAPFDSAWFSVIFSIRWPVQGVARLFFSLPTSRFSCTIYCSALFTYDADAQKRVARSLFHRFYVLCRCYWPWPVHRARNLWNPLGTLFSNFYPKFSLHSSRLFQKTTTKLPSPLLISPKSVWKRCIHIVT